MEGVLRGACAALLLLTFSLGVHRSVAQNRAEVRAGHTGAVRAIAYAPDGKSFATASADNTIKIWSAAQNSEIRTLSGHRGDVFSVAYSPDGEYIASASADQTAKIWDANTGALLRTIPGNSKEPTSTWFVPDGKTLATIGIGVFRLWSVPDGKLLRTFQVPEWLAFSLRVSHDGSLAAWGGKGQAYVMDVHSGRMLWTFATKTDHCPSVAFSPDSRTLAIPIADAQVELHDMHSGALVRTLTPPPDLAAKMFKLRTLSYLGLAFSPDGHALTTVGQRVRQWDLETGRITSESTILASAMTAVDYSPDGRTLAMGQGDGGVGTQHTMDVAAERIGNSPRPRLFPGEDPEHQFKKADSNSRRPWNAAFSHDSKTIATVGLGKDIDFWDLATGTIAARVTTPFVGASFVRFSEDGKTLVVGGAEGVVLLDAATHRELRRYPPMVLNAQISPDGHFLGAFYPAGDCFLIDLTKDKNRGDIDIFRPDMQPVTALAFSVDSKSFAVGSTNDIIVIWMLGSGKTQTLKAGANWVDLLAYSRDGRFLAAATNDGSIYLWNLVQGGTRSLLRKPGGRVYSVAFTPDGQTLAAVEDGGPIVFRDVSNGHETGRFTGGDGQVGDLTFSPDGKRFFTSGANSITVWDPSGKPLASLYVFEDGSSVVMTPEGYYDASSESAEEKVSVRVSGALYPISSYREKFYRPDLVRLALQGASLSQFGRLDQVKVAPSVTFLPMPAATGNGQISVKLKLADRGGGIGQLRLFVNGSAVIEDTIGSRDIPDGAKEIQRSYVVHLPTGKSELKAIVFNSDNSMQSTPDTATITSETPPLVAPALYALVVGIQKFQNPRFDLQYSISDAQLFASTLQQHAAGLYSKVTVQTLTTPEETTREGVIAALKTARGAVGPNDLFVFYVASHGVSDDGAYFLITSNVGSPSTERLKTDALDKETLTKLLANIPSTKKLIVIDTCQAAALGDPLSAALLTRGMTDIVAAKILSRAVGSTVLAATNSDQEAVEGYQGHGLFTFVVAQGLAGKADPEHSGYVSTLELAQYVEIQVPVLAEQVFKRKQFPTAAPSGQSFPVVKVD